LRNALVGRQGIGLIALRELYGVGRPKNLKRGYFVLRNKIPRYQANPLERSQ
jgi:hypothetical protein